MIPCNNLHIKFKKQKLRNIPIFSAKDRSLSSFDNKLLNIDIKKKIGVIIINKNEITLNGNRAFLSREALNFNE
jgi:hypothetical protein